MLNPFDLPTRRFKKVCDKCGVALEQNWSVNNRAFLLISKSGNIKCPWCRKEYKITLEAVDKEDPSGIGALF
jgi:hypothetical protein